MTDLAFLCGFALGIVLVMLPYWHARVRGEGR